MLAGIFFLLLFFFFPLKVARDRQSCGCFFRSAKKKFERAENTPFAVFWELNSYRLSPQKPPRALNCTPICLKRVASKLLSGLFSPPRYAAVCYDFERNRRVAFAATGLLSVKLQSGRVLEEDTRAEPPPTWRRVGIFANGPFKTTPPESAALSGICVRCSPVAQTETEARCEFMARLSSGALKKIPLLKPDTPQYLFMTNA